MKRYAVILKVDEEGVICLQLAGAEGCLASGDTLEEAFMDLAGACNVWQDAFVEETLGAITERMPEVPDVGS